MRELPAKKIVETLSALCLTANTELPEDVSEALGRALKNETSPLGREILRQIINNHVGIIERGQLLMHGPIDDVYRRIRGNRMIDNPINGVDIRGEVRRRSFRAFLPQHAGRRHLPATVPV